jgi:hypothetical protein
MAGVVVVIAVACGLESVDGRLEPIASEVCLSERRVCISVPTGAVEEPLRLRISTLPADALPGGQLGDGYDISAIGRDRVEFLKPARISFSLDGLGELADIPNVNLLRLHTRDGDGPWQPLENAFVDRVRNVITGETTHLSPFIVLRTDRLPDGGIPVELDGGQRDAGVIVIPPFDGGRPDAGQPDAGRPDAGAPDAGPPDAGAPDAGPPDAGAPDAGPPDAGAPDAGPPDAGAPDAGPPDAGGADAGEPDAGDPDAGEPDAGEPDAGEPDAGEPDAGG